MVTFLLPLIGQRQMVLLKLMVQLYNLHLTFLRDSAALHVGGFAEIIS